MIYHKTKHEQNNPTNFATYKKEVTFLNGQQGHILCQTPGNVLFGLFLHEGRCIISAEVVQVIIAKCRCNILKVLSATHKICALLHWDLVMKYR